MAHFWKIGWNLENHESKHRDLTHYWQSDIITEIRKGVIHSKISLREEESPDPCFLGVTFRGRDLEFVVGI